MTQPSEERLPASNTESPPPTPSARILPFERPQSDLQRAIQVRAQEAIDRDRDLDLEERRPKPLKWLIILLIAMIPVLLIFAAVDGFLRAFYKINETYNSAPAPAPASEQATPPETNVQTTPGVVILQPYDQVAQPPASADSPPKEEEKPAPRQN